MAVAPATRRDVAAHGPSAGSGGGAEARAQYRRRRAHSHRPGLCSDKWGASCPDVWSRGRRASPRQRGSCLGRRRSDVVPGPTKPVQPLSPPQRGASSRTCDRPQRPRNPPPHGRRASDPREERRPPCPQVDADTALLEVMQRAPTRSNPLFAYLRKTPPGPTGPARDPDRSQSKEDHPTASARAPPPGNNCCFTPRPASKDDKKTQSNLTQGD